MIIKPVPAGDGSSRSNTNGIDLDAFIGAAIRGRSNTAIGNNTLLQYRSLLKFYDVLCWNTRCTYLMCFVSFFKFSAATVGSDKLSLPQLPKKVVRFVWFVFRFPLQRWGVTKCHFPSCSRTFCDFFRFCVSSCSSEASGR